MLLQQFQQFSDQFLTIQPHPDPLQPWQPAWLNAWFPPLDAIALFGLLSLKKPNIYLEIGSGHSTLFAAKAKQLNSPTTQIISIDPQPRVAIDNLCDRVIRCSLEECDMSIFDELSANDFVFFDGSHRILPNSDNTVLFLEVIPRLKSQVYIHLHDIFWPFDYPDRWVGRMYSEQYMLGLLLLYAQEQFEIILPNAYISYQTDLPKLFHELNQILPRSQSLNIHGGSFWLRKN